MILLDTSAVLPLINEADPIHSDVTRLFGEIAAAGERLLIHNYMIAEAVSLIQRRIGFQAAAAFLASVPTFEMHWVTEDEHRDACGLFLSRGLRRLSIVDCTSFVVMRNLGIATAFTLDNHFIREGFTQYGS